MKPTAYQQNSWNPCQFTLNVYQADSTSLSRLMRLSRRNYETGIASLATSYWKVFFAYVQRYRLLSRQTDLGVIAKELEEQAKLLNEFFDTVFRPDGGQPIAILPIPSAIMGIPIFTPCLVHKELSTLDTSKSPGPDQLHPKLLKWLATFLKEPLTNLLNNSLATVECGPKRYYQLPPSEPDLGWV